MKVLLDEGVPKQLKIALNMFESYTLKNMEWQGTKNGQLLSKADEQKFDVFITVDKNLQFQQNLSKYSFGVIVIDVYRTKWEFIEPLVPKIIETINTIEPKKATVIKEIIKNHG